MAIAFATKFLDFKNLGLFKKETSVIGVDIGSSSIKVVQLRREGGQAILETYGELSLGPYASLSVGQATNLPAEKIVEAMDDLFREANVTTRRGALSLPLKSSLLKVIELPNIAERDLPAVVPIEARKYIPVPISEVSLDWWVIPKRNLAGAVDEPSEIKAGGKIQVLLVAIHNETIKKYQDIAQLAKIETSGFEVETFSAIRAVLGRDIAPTVILDLGASASKLAIVDSGIVKVSHTINRGSQEVTVALSKSLSIDFGQAERLKREGMKNMPDVARSTIEYIFYEVSQIIGDFQKKEGRIISKIILIGGGSLLDGIRETAKKNFTSELIFGDPFSKTKTPAFLSEVLLQAGPEFAIALGLALREIENI